MQTNEVIFARTHADFLNQLLHTTYKSYMKCTCRVDYNHTIWLIRLNNRESGFGWTNRMTNNGNTICEFYTGDPESRLYGHKSLNPCVKRLVFDIYDSAKGMRKYVFCGVYEYDTASDNVNRIWNKVSDRFDF